MSAVMFLVILCLVLAYILYDNSRKNKKLVQPATPTVFKKNDSYMLECQILNEMVREKERNGKMKVSMHFRESDGKFEGLREVIRRLGETMEFYMVVNVKDQKGEIIRELEGILEKKRIFRCKTREGELALIRQLSARIHIQTDIGIIKTLKPYLKSIVTVQDTLLGEQAVLKTSINLYGFKDLQQVFSSIQKLKF